MSQKQNSQTHQSATPALPPRRIVNADKELWNKSADVVVVGWGAAGAAAALQAREDGASVIVLERFAGGGASRLSGGVIYAGGGTAYQREAGFEDSVEGMYTYLQKETNQVISDATLRRFCEQSISNLAWMEKQGVRFQSSFMKEKSSYPSKKKFLYYSGNEAVPAYIDPRFKPAPRGHRSYGEGLSGAAMMDALEGATVSAGAQVLTQTNVRRLIIDEDKRVVGVECYQLPAEHVLTKRHADLSLKIAKWRQFLPNKAQAMRNEQAKIEQDLIDDGTIKPTLIRARKGVVLATGGFVFNLEMLEEHAPHYTDSFLLGAAGCDGSGIRLGATVGGASGHMSTMSGWRFISPPVCWQRGIVVNSQGARFCNEQVYGATLGHELMEKQGGKAYLIIDKNLRRQALKECVTAGWWYFQWLPALISMFAAKRAKTLPELARKIGADAANLTQSMQAYNAAIGQPATDALHPSDPWGKAADMCQALDQAPYYAIDISVTSPYLPMASITLGGLQVNEETGQVKSREGLSIAGLYAAGRSAVGIASSRYMSGLSLADCVFSGRRAAQHAAQIKVKP